MKHLTLLDPDVAAEGALIKRTAGRYFTPAWLASAVASKCVAAATGFHRLQVVDPFCGDGRLIIALLDQLNKTHRMLGEVKVSLWDNCGENIRMAQDSVRRLKSRLRFRVKVRTKLQDSFLETRTEYGRYDVVITNPPWETIKPDSREMRELATKTFNAIRNELREYDQQLAGVLPNSQPVKKLYGWGTNLSRCGLELSINLLANGGVCGIVLPSAIYGDQMSTKLREWLFTQVQITSIDQYPAEARLFDGVDQPVMTTILKKVKSPVRSRVIVTRHDRAHNAIGMARLDLAHRNMRSLDFRIPTELTPAEFELQKRLADFPALSNWEICNGGPLWLGRELDETNYKSFVTSSGKVPFVKGRDIQRFSAVTARAPYLISESRKVPPSVGFQRLAWRDVSRRSQTRRMFATLIPKGFVTGNSLNVGYFADEDAIKLRALLGIFNSLIFEFQLRTRLATGHISLGSVRSVHVPDLDDKKLLTKLAKLVSRAMERDLDAEASIERLIADALDLSTDERIAVVSHFDGLPVPLITLLRNKLGTGGRAK